MTVAVLDHAAAAVPRVREGDVTYEFFRSGGPGGQNVNKVSSGVRIRHIPTGIATECRETRDQGKNRKIALEKLQTILDAGAQGAAAQRERDDRRGQVGSGMRGDKIRTYREKDDVVTDHKYGNQTRLSKLLKGDWDDLK